MARALLADVIFALKDDISGDEILSRLLVALSRDGHGRLLAWLGQKTQEINALQTKNNTLELFESIIQVISDSTESETDAKLQVLLVATAAMGFSICSGARSWVVLSKPAKS